MSCQVLSCLQVFVAKQKFCSKHLATITEVEDLVKQSFHTRLSDMSWF